MRRHYLSRPTWRSPVERYFSVTFAMLPSALLVSLLFGDSVHRRRSFCSDYLEGAANHQAVIALARRRVDVLWAMLRDGQTYTERPSQAA
jgi:hypothetical protein